MLWFRDKAYLMRHPSIDRIDSNGNYELNNCQFIEMKRNRVKDRRAKFVHPLSRVRLCRVCITPFRKRSSRRVFCSKKCVIRGNKISKRIWHKNRRMVSS
jgi:hypothetical protein